MINMNPLFDIACNFSSSRFDKDLDQVISRALENNVKKLKDRNIGILITDHNVQETLAITDKTYLMFEGSILTIGEDKEL